MHKVMDETDEISIRHNLLDDITLRWIIIGITILVSIVYQISVKGAQLIPLIVIFVLAAIINYAYLYFMKKDIKLYNIIFIAEAVIDAVLNIML